MPETDNGGTSPLGRPGAARTPGSAVLADGDVLLDRYRLDGRIGTGGMGEVWRATDTLLNRVVAVKVLRGDLANDAAFGARFRGEARALAALRHPGVVDVFDYGEVDRPGLGPVAWLVMAYIDGEPLSDRIAATDGLAPAETLSIVAQAARALHAAHTAGIVHRDVKPGNLLVQPDGRVVLVDFGVAHTGETSGLTDANEVVGTSLYMAPEQVVSQDVSPATDIYALGAVAYHCVTGHPPFVADNPVAVAISQVEDEPPLLPDDVPAVLRELIGRAMAKDPADRYPTAAAMAEAAEAAHAMLVVPSATASMPALRGESAADPPAPPLGTGTGTARRRPGSDRPVGGVLLGLLLPVLAVTAIFALANPLAAPDSGDDFPAPRPGTRSEFPVPASGAPGARTASPPAAGGWPDLSQRATPATSPASTTTRPTRPPVSAPTRTATASPSPDPGEATPSTPSTPSISAQPSPTATSAPTFQERRGP